MDVDDDEADSSDDDDDDEEDAGGDESDGSDVPEEFKQKIREALGRHAVPASNKDGDGNSSDEGEFLGDDDMAVYDEKLSEIFKERKKSKMGDKGEWMWLWIYFLF